MFTLRIEGWLQGAFDPRQAIGAGFRNNCTDNAQVDSLKTDARLNEEYIVMGWTKQQKLVT